MNPQPGPRHGPRYAQPPSPAKNHYIQVVQQNSAISYADMLRELKELQTRIEQEHDDALRFFSGLYARAGLFPRLLSPEEISKRVGRLVMVEAQYTRDSTTVKRFIRLMDYIVKNGGNRK
jgi:hypothetical protein